MSTPKRANGDMLQYFADNPDKLAEKLMRDKNKAAASLDELATLDIDLTAGTLPRVALDLDLAALEQQGRMAAIDRSANQQVAQIILGQLGGSQRLSVMIGANNFISQSTPLPGVSFKFAGKKKGGNHVKILLAGDDTYNVEFGYTRGLNFTALKSLNGVYAGDLSGIFSRQTGQRLRLASGQMQGLARRLAKLGSDEGDMLLSRFEEGEDADPTENMSEEDAKIWREQTEKHKDKFKNAAQVDFGVFNSQHPYHRDLELIEGQRRTLIGTGRFDIPGRRAGILVKAGMVSVIEGQFGKELELTSKGKRSLGNSQDSFSKFAAAPTERDFEKILEKKNLNMSDLVGFRKWEEAKKRTVEEKIEKIEKWNSLHSPAKHWTDKKADSKAGCGCGGAEDESEVSDGGDSLMAEGCPDNLDKAECGEWEANTEKYKDKFAGSNNGFEEVSRIPDGWDAGFIEGEESKEKRDIGSDTPDGSGNLDKRASSAPDLFYRKVEKDLVERPSRTVSGPENVDLHYEQERPVWGAEIVMRNGRPALYLHGDWYNTPQKAADALNEKWGRGGRMAKRGGETLCSGCSNPIQDLSNDLEVVSGLNMHKKCAEEALKREKKGSEIINEMYALVSTDGYMLGATDSWSDATNKAFWSYTVAEDHSVLYTMTDVPLALAGKFIDVGTRANKFSNGHVAWKAARKFTNQMKRPMKLARSGMYGFTKKVQADCESCVRKVQKAAHRIAKGAYGKNEKVAEFLSRHASRSESLPAQILVAALAEMGPKVAGEMQRSARLEELRAQRTAQRQVHPDWFVGDTVESKAGLGAGYHGRVVGWDQLPRGHRRVRGKVLVLWDGTRVPQQEDASKLQRSARRTAGGDTSEMLKEQADKKAAPRGKAQQALAKHVSSWKAGNSESLSEIAKGAAFKGIHFAKIMSAAEALAKSGLIEFDDVKVTKKAGIDGGRVAANNFKVQMIDADSGKVEWEGSAKQLLKDNEDDPDDVEEALKKLRRSGDEANMGGGAAAEWKLKRMAADEKTARKYGLYGFGDKVASSGLQACSDVRAEAGRIAYDLHRRRAAKHARITGFLDTHCKTAECRYSRLLHASYPAADSKVAALNAPRTVQAWLEWED